MLYLGCRYWGKQAPLFRIAPKWEQRLAYADGGLTTNLHVHDADEFSTAVHYF